MTFKQISAFLVIFILNFTSSYPIIEEAVEDSEDGYQPFEEEPYEVVDFERPQIRFRREVFGNSIQPGVEEIGEVTFLEEPLIRNRRQLLGGASGPTQTIGYRNGPFFGSMSHSGGPITYTGGAMVGPSQGPNAFLSASKTQGFSTVVGTAGASIPLHTTRTSSLSLSGQANFAHGMIPDREVALTFNKKF